MQYRETYFSDGAVLRMSDDPRLLFRERHTLSRQHADILRTALANVLRRNAGLPVKKITGLLREYAGCSLEQLARELAPGQSYPLETPEFRAALATALTAILADPFNDLDLVAPLCVTEVVESDAQVLTLPLPVDDDQWRTPGATLTRTVYDHGRTFRLMELKSLSLLLTSNPQVDNAPLFEEGINQTSDALTVESLNTALAYLARYEINSDYAALEPAALLIGPGRRASVGKTLRSCGFDSLPIYISPWLAPRAWYLLPKDHPALIRLVGKDREAPEVHWSGDSLTITLYRQFRLASRAIYQGGAGHD